MTHMPIPTEAITKLTTEQNIWFVSVRPDGRPHMAPVWFVWHNDRIYIGTDPESVKIRNIRSNPNVITALEDGDHPVICEGKADFLPTPYPEPLLAAFFQKYEWDVPADKQYHMVVEITPQKWLAW
jgi:PPOX class probable F420-dependent enzyme